MLGVWLLFMKAAQNVVTLAHGQTGKRQNAAATLAACRQLLAAFNALQVE
jgi:hypothetical protein